MSDVTWTKKELKEFDKLTMMCSSQNQVTRIDGRFKCKAFVALHGQEKCDAMYNFLMLKDSKKAHRR